MADVITCNPFNLSDHITGSNGANQWKGFWLSNDKLLGRVQLQQKVRMGLLYGIQNFWYNANVSVCPLFAYPLMPGSKTIIGYRNDYYALIDASGTTFQLYGATADEFINAIFFVTDFNEPTP